MQIRDKISEGWQITQTHGYLRWFMFFPALLTTLVGAVWMLYQYLTLGNFIMGQKINYSSTLTTVLDFVYKNGQFSVTAIFLAIFLGVCYLLLPAFFQGGLIGMLDEIREKEQSSVSRGVSTGLFAYLRMFELHTLLSPFNPMTIFSLFSSIVRAMGWAAMQLFAPVFIIMLIFSFFINFFTAYSDFSVVLRKTKMMPAITESGKLVILHLPETAVVLVLMLLITLRVVINIILILVIPIVLLLGMSYLSLSFSGIWLWIITLIALALTLLSSYLASIMIVFTTCTWLLIYRELSEISAKEMED